MPLFSKDIAWLKAEFAKLESALQKAIPAAVKAILVFRTIVENPTFDAVLKSLTNGLITQDMLTTLNTVLLKLTAGLIEIESIDTLTPEQILQALALKWSNLNPSQQEAALTQAAHDITIATGGKINITNAELKAIEQVVYANPDMTTPRETILPSVGTNQ